MFQKTISFLAPHHCYNCHKIGSPLCDRCKNYLLQSLSNGVFLINNLPIKYLSDIDGLMKDLIYDYKINSKQALADVFALSIYEDLKDRIENCIIIPIPTIKKNQRQRGFDHMLLIAQKLADLSGWSWQSILTNVSPVAQKTLNAKQRQSNARIICNLAKINSNEHYLLIDDVVTTGATFKMSHAALTSAGAKKITNLALWHKK